MQNFLRVVGANSLLHNIKGMLPVSKIRLNISKLSLNLSILIAIFGRSLSYFLI